MGLPGPAGPVGPPGEDGDKVGAVPLLCGVTGGERGHLPHCHRAGSRWDVLSAKTGMFCVAHSPAIRAASGLGENQHFASQTTR